jgi:hypothetical protein
LLLLLLLLLPPPLRTAWLCDKHTTGKPCARTWRR